MRLEKSYYCKIAIGPSGRKCSCCVPNRSQILKRMEHRKARQEIKRDIRCEVENINA